MEIQKIIQHLINKFPEIDMIKSFFDVIVSQEIIIWTFIDKKTNEKVRSTINFLQG